jgi:hypothetical protein
VPFVRFSRDKRGYEHVYLIDSSKERGRSRVLYWFRTPPGVKVGRAAFDPDTQRSLERQNPDVQFDWPQIVAARIPPPVPVENWREKRRAEKAIKRARAAESMGTAELADNVSQIAEEFDEPLDERDEGRADEADEAHEAHEIVEVAGEGGSQTLIEVEVELTGDSISDTAPPARSEGTTEPPGGRRGKRRRRRRGRHSGNRPDASAQSAAGPNEPLDPANLPEKPSDEG